MLLSPTTSTISTMNTIMFNCKYEQHYHECKHGFFHTKKNFWNMITTFLPTIMETAVFSDNLGTPSYLEGSIPTIKMIPHLWLVCHMMTLKHRHLFACSGLKNMTTMTTHRKYFSPTHISFRKYSFIGYSLAPKV